MKKVILSVIYKGIKYSSNVDELTEEEFERLQDQISNGVPFLKIKKDEKICIFTKKVLEKSVILIEIVE